MGWYYGIVYLYYYFLTFIIRAGFFLSEKPGSSMMEGPESF